MNTVILIAFIFNCIAVLTCGYAAVRVAYQKEIFMSVTLFFLMIVNALFAVINIARLTGRF